WRDPVKPIEDKPFAYTTMSLNKVYETGFAQALEMVRRSGGTVDGESIRLPAEAIKPVPLEVSFEDCFPVERKRLGLRLEAAAEIVFEGTGYVLTGGPSKMDGTGAVAHVHRVEIVLDDRLPVVVALPVDERVRRLEVAWGYRLAPGPHILKLRLLEPRPGDEIRLDDLITYADRPAAARY
ncbi:MAG: hypothetical protein HGA24_09205, partial [Candidatus Aminicenantes bacterium]|nr:hypothetical protein [Candidatus Aminicenantes bacterium]